MYQFAFRTLQRNLVISLNNPEIPTEGRVKKSCSAEINSHDTITNFEAIWICAQTVYNVFL